jgi:wyosine [tRNA(Phe)-imidazoG37] synthetase (radical SAM superfamily)
MPEEVKKMPFPIPLQRGVIYGPVHSKRLGLSLGINLLPAGKKICNLDCLYCFYGRTDFRPKSGDFPAAEAVLAEIESALKKGQALNYITFSGNGAATLHPEFGLIVKKTVELRDRYYPGLPLAILCNSAGLNEDKLKTLDLIDHRIMKLDSAEEAVFRKMNRPKRGIKLKDIISTLSTMRGVIIQTLFAGGIDNHKGQALEKWTKAVMEIEPAGVQVYTLDCSLPDVGLFKIENGELFTLAEKLTQKMKLPVKAFCD